jgi:CheY-like chemotaxis protein
MPSHVSKRLPILVVEDNKETQLLLKHLLAEQFSVEVASDGAAAVQCAHEHDYRLILMDINLGGAEDGIAIHRKIRRIRNYHTIPIVAVTAYALPGDRERFVQAGFDAYLSKPFTRRELLTTIAELLPPDQQ